MPAISRRACRPSGASQEEVMRIISLHRHITVTIAGMHFLRFSRHFLMMMMGVLAADYRSL